MDIDIRLFKTTARRAAVALSLAVAIPAQAEMVAGWDFSQYLGAGILSIDGVTFTDTLDANYSHRVPAEATNSGIAGVGPQAAAFGTMYIDGQFGSTAVAGGSGTEQFLPTASVSGSLASNLRAPVAVADGFPLEFDVFTTLVFEGQTFAESLAMIASESVNVTFSADRGAPPPGGSNWILSFGGRTFSGESLVGIDFSDNGSSFASVTSLEFTEVDTPYIVDLGPATSQTAFVRFRFDPMGPDQPIIDNVAISVPEAGGLASGVAALGALFACRRRRA